MYSEWGLDSGTKKSGNRDERIDARGQKGAIARRLVRIGAAGLTWSLAANPTNGNVDFIEIQSRRINRQRGNPDKRIRQCIFVLLSPEVEVGKQTAFTFDIERSLNLTTEISTWVSFLAERPPEHRLLLSPQGLSEPRQAQSEFMTVSTAAFPPASPTASNSPQVAGVFVDNPSSTSPFPSSSSSLRALTFLLGL